MYVFCILAPGENSVMGFYIDNVLRGQFIQRSTGYEYNLSVFSIDSLDSGNHTLVIQNGLINGSTSSTLLDYIVYTYVRVAMSGNGV